MHVVADLGTYGAERLVAVLLERLRDPELELSVMTVAPRRAGAAPAHVEQFSANRHGRYDLGFLGRMAGVMRAWRPEIVHTHTHAGKYWGRLAAVLAGVPAIVHTEHNSEFGAPAPFRLLNRLLLRRTDALVTFSAAQRARLVADEGVPPGRVSIIPNGIAIAAPADGARAGARGALGAGPAARVLVHVGRLSVVKNQALAIEALALLPAGVRLALIGEGRERAALERRARELAVADRTAFLGYRDDAAALLAGADVAIVTSHNEAMPLAIIEAQIGGVPVVSTPWRGAAEMLGDGTRGVLARDFTPVAFAAAVRGVLDDPAGTAARSAAAAGFARAEYDIDTVAQRHLALYREVIARTRSASRAITMPRS